MTDKEAKELVEEMRKYRDEILRLRAAHAACKVLLEQGGRRVPKDVLVKVSLR